MIVHIPPRWRAHTVGDVRATHVVRKQREGYWVGGDGVPINVILLPGHDGGMLAITVDGHTFYLTPRGESYAGGARIDDVPTALVARITDAGCVVEIRDAVEITAG